MHDQSVRDDAGFILCEFCVCNFELSRYAVMKHALNEAHKARNSMYRELRSTNTM